jgi:hypothetical protein
MMNRVAQMRCGCHNRQLAVLLYLALVCASSVSAGTGTVSVQQSVSGYPSTYPLTVEDFWREVITFRVTLTKSDPADEFEFLSFSDEADFLAESILGVPGVVDGVAAVKTSLFTASRESAMVYKFTARASSLLGFVSPSFDTIQFRIKEARIFNYTAGDVSTGKRNITGLSTNASSEITVQNGPLNELVVRNEGILLRVDVQFNQFKLIDASALKLVSNHPVLHNASVNWTMFIDVDAVLPTSRAYFQLPPLPTFNISSSVWLFAMVDVAKMRVPNPIVPNSANITITTIDSQPLSFCQVLGGSITEASLRDAGDNGVLRNITLDPPLADSFRTSPRQEIDELILASVIASTELNIIVANVTSSVITLRIVAKSGAQYDTDVTFPISIVLQPRVLASREAGCGRTFIAIQPSPGIVRGVTSQRVFLETDINDNSHEIEFQVLFDKFAIGATVSTQVTLLIVDPTYYRSSAEYAGWTATIATTAEVVLNTSIPSRVTQLYVRFPATAAYNIPTGTLEVIRVSIPATAMASGLAPNMTDASFNITYAPVTMNVTFGDITDNHVTCEQLWDRGANLTLTIRGDTWDTQAVTSWSERHPLIAGTITTGGTELYAMEQTIERLGKKQNVIEFSKVIIKSRVAQLRILPLPGLSLPFEERVRVGNTINLIRGSTASADSTFIVTQVATIMPASFSGAATQGRAITEKELRSGFWFMITLQYQVFRLSALTSFRDLFPQATSLTPFLGNCNATRDPLWTYNFSCPELPDYDIDSDEVMSVKLPREFIYEPLATQNGGDSAIIIVLAAVSPVCSWSADVKFTEGDVRSAFDGILLVIKSSLPFVDKPNLLNVSSVIRSTHQFDHPLNFEIQQRLEPLLLHIKILSDPTYEINTNDVVSVNLNRFFFLEGERCNPLNFTISVLPGSGFGTGVSQNAQASWLREGPIVFNITLVGERVVRPSFDLNLAVSYPFGATASKIEFGINGFSELIAQGNFKVTARALTEWNVTTANSTVFQVVIPRTPAYKILEGGELDICDSWKCRCIRSATGSGRC